MLARAHTPVLPAVHCSKAAGACQVQQERRQLRCNSVTTSRRLCTATGSCRQCALSAICNTQKGNPGLYLSRCLCLQQRPYANEGLGRLDAEEVSCCRLQAAAITAANWDLGGCWSRPFALSRTYSPPCCGQIDRCKSLSDVPGHECDTTVAVQQCR